MPIVFYIAGMYSTYVGTVEQASHSRNNIVRHENAKTLYDEYSVLRRCYGVFRWKPKLKQVHHSLKLVLYVSVCF